MGRFDVDVTKSYLIIPYLLLTFLAKLFPFKVLGILLCPIAATYMNVYVMQIHTTFYACIFLWK